MKCGIPKGYKHRPESYLSRSGPKHWSWKGKNVGYNGVHDWIKKHHGIAHCCEHCGATEKPKGKKRWFEWACVTNNYTRNIKDWKQLCVPCHRKHDNWSAKVQSAPATLEYYRRRKRNSSV